MSQFSSLLKIVLAYMTTVLSYADTDWHFTFAKPVISLMSNTGGTSHHPANTIGCMFDLRGAGTHMV